MKWLVTGAAGFIGSNIVGELLERKENVVGIDDLSTGRKENILCYDFEFVQGSVTDKGLLKKLMKDSDYVIHLAAIPSVPRSIENPERSHEVNCLGTLRILEAAKEVNKEAGKEQIKKIVFASSSSAYGNRSNNLPAKKEDLPVDPLSPYAAMKVYGENLCRTFSEAYGLKTVALRYFNVFGPKQDPDSPYSAVIPIFIKAILKDEQPTIFGDGLTSRDFTYVANVVDGTIKAAISDNVGSGEVINIALGESVTLNELEEEICSILKKDIKPIYSEERKGDVKHSKADISRAKSLLGFEPLVSFRAGLIRTIEFYRK